jgi:hypothetical protein
MLKRQSYNKKLAQPTVNIPETKVKIKGQAA